MYFELVGNSTQFWSRLLRLSILYATLKIERAAGLEDIQNSTVLTLKRVFKYWNVNFGRKLVLKRADTLTARSVSVIRMYELYAVITISFISWTKFE